MDGTLSGTNELVLSGSGTTISGTGTVTVKPTMNGGSKTIPSGTDLLFSFAGDFKVDQPVTNNGSITIVTSGKMTGGSTWTNAANSVLNNATSNTDINTLTASADPNTVTYNRTTGNQTMKGAPYHHLVIDTVSNNATMGGGTTVGGDLTVNSGTFVMGGNALTVPGDLIVNGTITGTNTLTLSGAGKSLDGSGSIAPNITINASHTVLSSASLTISGTINLSGAITLTNNGTVNSTGASGITGSVAGSTWLNAGSSTLNVSGPVLATGTLTAIAVPNTVNYSGGGNVNVKITNYHHLSIAKGGSTATIANASPITINGNLTILSGTLNAGNSTHDLKGSYSNSGTFTHGDGTMRFSGTTVQSLSGNMTAVSSSAFNNLTITNASGTDPDTNPSVIFNSAAQAGTLTITTANVKVQFAAGQTFTFTTFTLNGQAAETRVRLRSTVADTPWLLNVTGTPPTVLNTNPQDSDASPGSAILASVGNGNLDEGNNTNWIFGNACSSVATGNWSTAGTWAFPCNVAGGPGAADAATISSGHVVTVTAAAQAAQVTIAANAGAGNGININSGITLTVNGSVTMNAPTAATSDFNVGAGTLIANSIKINGSATAGRFATMSVSTGTVTTSGSVTFAGTAAQARFTFTGTGTLNVGKNFGSGGTLTTVAGSTINFNGASAQTIGTYTTYRNVSINNTSGGVTFTGTTTIQQNVTVTTGTIDFGGVATIVNGTTSVSGTLQISSAAGSNRFDGLVTINPAGTWNNTANAAVNFRGGITNNGTFNSGTGVQTFDTNAQAIGGSATTIPNVTVTTIVLTNNITTGGLTVSTALSGTGTLRQGANAILNVGGSPIAPGLDTATNPPNTVVYNGTGAQQVKNVAYHHLTIDNLGQTATLQGGSAINGNLTVAPGAILASGGQSPSVSGNLIVDGTYSGGGTTTLNGVGTTLDGTGSIAPTVIINTGNKSVLLSASLTFNGNVTVTGVTTTNNGIVTLPTLAGTGSWTNAAGSALRVNTSITIATFNASAIDNTVNYSGSGDQSIVLPVGSVYHHLTSSGGTNTPAGALTINGDLRISAGTLDVTASNHAINLKGNYINNGTFNARAGTVTLSGTSLQTLSGNMTGTSKFNNVIITNNSGTNPDTNPSVIFSSAAEVDGTLTITTASVKVQFAAGQTQIMRNINFNGGSNTTRVQLRSTTAGTQWKLNRNAGGTQTVSNTDVKDSDASPGATVTATATSNLNSGNNLNWTFTSGCTSTGVTSAWNLSTTWNPPCDVPGGPDALKDVTILSAHTVTVTADAAAKTLTIANADGSSNGLTINSGIGLTIGSGGTGAITMTASTGAGNSTLLVGAGTLNAGSITVPGGGSSGNTIVSLSTGTINLTGGITFSGTAARAQLNFTGTGTLNLGGNLSAGGTLTAGTGTINFNGSGAQTAAGYTYNILKVNNQTGLTLTAAATIPTLTIGDAKPLSIFNDGGFQVTSGGTLNLTSGTFKLGAGAATTFPGFATNNIAAGTTVEYASGAAQTVSVAPIYQNLTMSGAGAKTVPAGTLEIRGNYNASGGAVGYTAANTARFSGTAGQTLSGTMTGSSAFNHIEVNSTATVNLGAAADLNGNLTITAGTLSTGASALAIKGNYTNNGTFAADGGTVTLNGTGSTQQTLSGTMTGTSAFNNLTITNNSSANPRIIFAAGATVSTFTATTASTSMRFNAGSTYNFTNINLNGQAVGTRVTLRSSTPGTRWFLNVTGTQTVLNTDAQDSDASGGNTIIATDASNLNSGNNVNWAFSGSCTSKATGLWKDASTWNAPCDVVGGPDPGKVVTISSGHTVTLTAPAGANTITLAATASGTTKLDVGNQTLSVGSGGITINGGAANSILEINAGTVNVTGGVTFAGTAAQARLTFVGSGALNLGGNLSAGGNLTAGTGTINFNGTGAQTAAGYTYNTLKSNNAAGVTLTGAATVSKLTIGDAVLNSVFNDGGFQVTSTGILDLLSGKFKLGAGTATTFPAFTSRAILAGTTVEYASGAAQTVSLTPIYQNLTMSGAGTKTVPAGTLEIRGNYTASGGAVGFNAANTTRLSGTAQQTMSGTMTGGSAFAILTITNNSGTNPDTTPSVIFSTAATATTVNITTPSVKVRFGAGLTYTFTNINFDGQNIATRVQFRSSSTPTRWIIARSGTQTVRNVDVQDSNATPSAVDATHISNLDSGNNLNWSFAPDPAFGEGRIVYADNGNATPQQRTYTVSTNAWSNPATGTAAGDQPASVRTKSARTRDQYISAYVDSGGTLRVMCYDGATWSEDWTVSVGSSADLGRRFDVAYERETDIPMVVYSRNVSGTNELGFRRMTSPAPPAGPLCGAANWTGETTINPQRINGTVRYVKLEAKPKKGSNDIAMIFVDNNEDLSAMIWNGSSWGNEPSFLIEGKISKDGSAADEESADLAYEALTGDLLIAWGRDGTKGFFYLTRTGSSWGTAIASGGLDRVEQLVLAPDPISDKILLAAIDKDDKDLTIGIWSGSSWTIKNNVDVDVRAAVKNRKYVSAGWLNSGLIKRGIVAYDSNTNTIDWVVISGTNATVQSSFSPSPAITARAWMEIQSDPVNLDRLILTFSDTNNDLFAKRLKLSSDGTLAWSNTEPGGAALETDLGTSNTQAFSFAFKRFVPPPVIANIGGCVVNCGARAGTTITINGSNFQVVQGTVTVNGADATVTNWTNTQITAIVPIDGLVFGNIVVTALDQDSAGFAFTITPTVTGRTPGKSVAGANVNVTISGDHFGGGPCNGTTNKVRFGATDVACVDIVSWSGSAIVAKVPVSLTAGVYSIVVRAEGAPGIGNDSNTNITYTIVSTADTTPPGEVSSPLVTDPRTGNQLTLSWTNPSDADFAGIRISRRLTTDGAPGNCTADVIATLTAPPFTTPGASVTFDDFGVVDNTPYSYLVCTFDDFSTSNLSTGVPLAGTPTDSIAPENVSDLTVDSIGDGTQLSLTWTNPSIGPQNADFKGVIISRLPGGVPPAPFCPVGTRIAVLDIPTAFFVDTPSGDPTGTYSYRVCSFDDEGVKPTTGAAGSANLSIGATATRGISSRWYLHQVLAQASGLPETTYSADFPHNTWFDAKRIRQMDSSKGAVQWAAIGNTGPGGNTVDTGLHFLRFWASPPLSAQTIPAASWKINIARSVNDLQANMELRATIYVWRPSGGSPAGSGQKLSPPIVAATPLSAIGQNINDNTPEYGEETLAGSSVTVQAGDRVILEVWAKAKQTKEFGQASSNGDKNTLNDNTKAWTGDGAGGAVDQWQGATVEIIAGINSGQVRTISSNTATSFDVSPDWPENSDISSQYVITWPCDRASTDFANHCEMIIYYDGNEVTTGQPNNTEVANHASFVEVSAPLIIRREPQRWYLHNAVDGTAGLPTTRQSGDTVNTNWEFPGTSTISIRNMNTVISPPPQASITASGAATGNHLIRAFASPPLSAQTIPAQSWTFNAARLQSNCNNNFRTRVYMYVWRPSTQTKVAEIGGPTTFGTANTDPGLCVGSSLDGLIKSAVQGPPSTLTDGSGRSFAANQWKNAEIAITAGRGVGQKRIISSNTLGSSTVDGIYTMASVWTTLPGKGGKYDITPLWGEPSNANSQEMTQGGITQPSDVTVAAGDRVIVEWWGDVTGTAGSTLSAYYDGVSLNSFPQSPRNAVVGSLAAFVEPSSRVDLAAVDAILDGQGLLVFDPCSPSCNGLGGTASKSVSSLSTVQYILRIRNEGSIAQAFDISWTTPAQPGWTVTLVPEGSVASVCDGSSNPDPTSPCRTGPLQPRETGGETSFFLQVTAPASPISQDIVITVRGVDVPAAADSVRAKAILIAAPSGLGFSSIGPTQLDISWVDNSNNEDGFFIEQTVFDMGVCPATTFKRIGNVVRTAPQKSGFPLAVGPFTISNLVPNTTYCYRVQAYDISGGASSYTPSVTVTTAAGGADVIAPAATTDLRVREGEQRSDAMIVNWTAPADDGNDASSGTAQKYILRYSILPIQDGVSHTTAIEDHVHFDDECNAAEENASKPINCAVDVTGIPIPQPKGNNESLTVRGLRPNTLYFFALKTRDDALNTSAISNIAGGDDVFDGRKASRTVLRNNFNLVSVPRVPAVGHPVEVFGDDVGGDAPMSRWRSTGLSQTTGCYDQYPGASTSPCQSIEILQGVWSFGEGTGTQANDSSGKGNKLNLFGNAPWTVTSTGGFVGFGLDLDGSTEYASIAHASQTGLEMDAQTSFVIEAWIFRSGTGTEDTIASKRNSSGGPGYRFFVGADDLLKLRLADSSTEILVVGDRTIQAGTWVNVRAVVDRVAKNARIFSANQSNGPLVSIATLGSLASGVDFSIGANFKTPDLGGRIDEVGVATFRPIMPGEGYFLQGRGNFPVIDVPAGSTQVALTSYCAGSTVGLITNAFSVPLLQGWNMVGLPFNQNLAETRPSYIPLGSTYVRQNGVNASCKIFVDTDADPTNDAVGLAWVGSALYSFNGSSYTADTINSVPPAFFEPWRGYWLYVNDNANTYELIFQRP